ncbi:shisa-6 -like protein [Brachionus plicatilis]|uniref:Shisa-6-like protein n=1 Tax=Brachionus plicatilis TaxID=10195 RepID=A0A3M7PHT1_BRAPC|nr:shisa-6 -like protein [Brachionus plicatilis]
MNSNCSGYYNLKAIYESQTICKNQFCCGICFNRTCCLDPKLFLNQSKCLNYHKEDQDFVQPVSIGFLTFISILMLVCIVLCYLESIKRNKILFKLKCLELKFLKLIKKTLK